MRKKFVEITTKIFQENDKAILLLGDIGVYAFSDLAKYFSNRVINTGIMEQTMLGFASGLSKRGLIPIIHSISPFIFERALEQIKIDFAYQQLQGNIVTVGASYDYTGLGPTHHGPADIPTLYNIPKINLFIPGTADEFKDLFYKNYNNGKLNYFRISEHTNSISFENETIFTSKNKSENYIIVVGNLLDDVIKACDDLNINIIYLNKIKKLSKSILQILSEAKRIVTIEPYYPGIILNLLNNQGINCKVKTIGVKKEFHNFYGDYLDHLKFDGLDYYSIRKSIIEFSC